MRTIDWDTDRDCVVMVDQTKLPAEYTTFHAETVPDDVGVYNPAFDPTPMELVDYLVTETGVYQPPIDSPNLDAREQTAATRY